MADNTECCTFCEHYFPNHRLLMRHIRIHHECDPSFVVNCSICGKSYKKWCSLKKHLHRSHKLVEDHPLHEGSDHIDSMLSQDDEIDYGAEDSTGIEVDQQWDNAQFLLCTANQLSLTHAGVTDLSATTSSFVEQIAEKIYSNVIKTLNSHEVIISDSLKEDLQESCILTNTFDGISTRATRECYYRKHFHYVEPTPVLLHKCTEWKSVCGTMKLVSREDNGYVVDLLDGLTALLNNPSVLKEVMLDHSSDDSVMRDYCDGSFIRNHSLFVKYPNALQFIVYYDDIEVCNPLGSSAGIHKLAVFYYILGNIRPVFRSTLQSMHVIAVAKANDIHMYGCHTLLQPFVEQMKLLGQDNGCRITLDNDTELNLHGAVVCMCGDTPASNFVAGFKEGVGFSLRKCRACFVTRDEMSSIFHSDSCTNRDLKNHLHYCNLVEGDDNGRGGFSTTYGINGRSVLLDLPFFDVTKCFPYDIMHTLFEGVSGHLFVQLYGHLIDDHIVTLQEINSEISRICSEYSEMDTIPAPVYIDSGKIRFKQKAAQMKTLIRYLPLAVGNRIPDEDEHWSCFIMYWEICNMSLAFEVTREDSTHLGWLVEVFLEMFKRLYIDTVNITPKVHHLVHLPEQMLRFGPLRHTWCMRFESKNKELKQYTSSCFKNVPLSVVIKHQQSLCFRLTVRPGTSMSSFLYHGDEVLGGHSSMIEGELVESVKDILGLEFLPDPFLVLKPSSVKIHGVKYARKAIVRIKAPENNISPFVYAMIKDIYVYKDQKVFLANPLNIDCHEL